MPFPVFKYFIAVVFFSAVTYTAFAEEWLREPPNFRSSAMGGTGISSANDTQALHYNPATMANVFDTLFDVLSLQIDYNEGGKALYDKANIQFNADSIVINKIKADEFLDILQENDNKIELDVHVKDALIYSFNREGFRFGLTFGQFVKAGFYLSGLTRKYSLFELANAVADPDSTIREEFNQAELIGRYRKDTYVKTGVSVPIWKGVVVLGLSYYYLKREEVKFNASLKDFLDSSSDVDATTSFKGNTEDSLRFVDAGFMLRIPGRIRMRLAVVYKNAFNTESSTVDVDTQELAVGVSFVPVYGKSFFGGVRLTLAADYRDIQYKRDTTSDSNNIKRTHFGMELGFFPYNMTYSMFAFRAGFNQGYFTYGAETNFGTSRNLIIGFSSYAEELGNDKKTIEDRRTAYYISFGF